MPFSAFTVAPGVNLEKTPALNQAGISISQNVRWREGIPEKRGGWQKKDGQPVANSDLWQLLDDLSRRYQVHWVNAKGQRLEGLTRAGQALTSA